MVTTDDLKYCLEKGIISLPDIQSIIEMERKKELLAKHPYQPWQGKNGSWYVYLPDKERGRILKKRKTKEGIENRRQATLQPSYFYWLFKHFFDYLFIKSNHTIERRDWISG